MSGSVYNVAMNSTCFTPMRGYIEYIDNGISYTGTEEQAGRVGMVLGAVASIFIPFAAPAVWGALTGSAGILSGLGAAASSTFGAGLGNVIGSSLAGAIMNAGTAYLSGARGGQVWAAAGMGAISGGGGALARSAGLANAATSGAASATPASITAGINTANSAGASLVGGAGGMSASAATTAGANAAMSGAPGVSGSVMQGIRQLFGNVSGDSIRRIGAVLINAAVNNQDMGRLNGMVEQQRQELAALAARDRTVYDQRIREAQNILAAADRNDPDMARLWAVADIAGAEHRQFRQAQRNIATRQGGSLDSGQAKAYERGAALHIARSKALAGNRAYKEAEITQNQLRSMGAQLLGPDTAGMAHWQNDTELEAGRERARREASHDTWGGLLAGITEGWGDHRPTTSPNPADPQEDDNPGWGGLGGWGGGS